MIDYFARWKALPRDHVCLICGAVCTKWHRHWDLPTPQIEALLRGRE